MKILLIEDDEILVAQLTDCLTAQHYLVESVGDGRLGLAYAQAATYDLVLVDLNLPGEDGISLCRHLRQEGYAGAILMQTTESDSDYKVAGLDAGADDYIVKPFSLDELSARIRALLRRPQGVPTPILQWGEVQLNPSTCQAFYGDRLLVLSPKEYSLLELFLRNPQRVFNSALLLERVWSFDESPGEETVRTHIKRLRQKLKQAGANGIIENIYGMGYRLRATEAHPPGSRTSEPQDLETQARQLATATIHQFQDIILSRLAVLDQAATAPVLSEGLRYQAQQAAHKLAGSLGMFGLPEGSAYSRLVETSLQTARGDLDRQHFRTLVDQIHQVLQPVLPTTPAFDPTQPGANGRVADDQQSTPLVPTVASATGPQLLVVSADIDWVQGLRRWAFPGLGVIHSLSLRQAQAQLSNSSPAIILLDMATLSDAIAELEPFSHHLAACPNIPIMAMTGTDSFEERFAIARHITCTFLPRTLDPEQMLAMVQDTLQNRCPSTVRLLAVDDDPMILQRLEQQLPQWGIQVTTLEDPRLLWETLLELNPDVLLLDVDMPHINGIQLCQIIRRDSRWAGLPILFLSASRTADTPQQMYTAGGDDYIPKPFTESELVTRIFNRLERRQQIHSTRPTPSSVGL